MRGFDEIGGVGGGSVEESGAAAQSVGELGGPPRDRAELAAWLRRHSGLRVPGEAVIAGHASPLDYLAHSFFEGRGRWVSAAELADGAIAAGGAPVTPPTPVDSVVWANRGGGKTFLGAVATLLDMVFKPGIEIRILGGSLEQSRRMHAHLRRLFDPRNEAMAALVDGRITERRLRLTNGSVVELLAQSQTSVRGTRVQKLRCDEVDLFDPEVWDAAQLTTRSGTFGGMFVPGSVECLSTMHVPWGMMHRLTREAAEGKRALFRWGVVDVLGECPEERRCRGKLTAGEHEDDPTPRAGDCPLWGECGGCAKRSKRPEREPGHIPITDAIGLKARVSLTTWNAEMLCLRPRRTDSVYPEFEHAAHVREDGPFENIDPPSERWFAGMDFGFRAPTAVIWGALAADGTLWILDERCEVGRLVEEHGQALLTGRARRREAWAAPAFVAVDPAGLAVSDQTGRSSVQILRGMGLTVRTLRKDIKSGLELVRARLRPADATQPPRLFIHPRCTSLIEALEKYHYPSEDPENRSPVKDGADHMADALRYLVQNLEGPGAMRQVRYA